jgi:hypothetical protein
VEGEVPEGLFPCELGGVCEAIDDDNVESCAEELQHSVAVPMYPVLPISNTTLPLAPASSTATICLTLFSLYSPGACRSATERGDDRTEEREKKRSGSSEDEERERS